MAPTLTRPTVMHRVALVGSLVAVFVVVWVSAPAPAEAGPSGPLATLKQKNTEVDRLLREKTDPGSPTDKKRKDEVKALAGSLLDYGELGRRAMANHWDTLSPEQRAQFNAKFRELIERHYVNQLKSNLDYQVLYKDEKIEGDEATLATLVKVKTKGKSTDAEIVYKLKNQNDHWMIYDVITDEVSLVRNYKTQFNKIITEKGYDELIKKIDARIKTESSP